MMVSSTPNPGEENLAFRGFQFTDATISPPAVTETESPAPRRRTSFNFLRRVKSTERMKSSRNVSGGKLTKRQSTQVREQEMAQQQREPTALASLELPAIPHAPSMQTFGGEDGRPDSIAIISNKAVGYTPNRLLPNGTVDMTKFHITPKIPVPAIPDVDPYASANSITNRGRYSYASSAVSTLNSPRRVRRRKDPTPFKYVPSFQLLSLSNTTTVFLLSEPVTLARRLSSNFCTHPLHYRCVSSDHPTVTMMAYHNTFIHVFLRISHPSTLRQKWTMESVLG